MDGSLDRGPHEHESPAVAARDPDLPPRDPPDDSAVQSRPGNPVRRDRAIRVQSGASPETWRALGTSRCVLSARSPDEQFHSSSGIPLERLKHRRMMQGTSSPVSSCVSSVSLTLWARELPINAKRNYRSYALEFPQTHLYEYLQARSLPPWQETVFL